MNSIVRIVISLATATIVAAAIPVGAESEVEWSEWQAAGSTEEGGDSCQEVINIFTLETRHSSCVDAFAYMYQASSSASCGANPQNKPTCWRMESRAIGYSGFSTTDGKVLAHNHEIVKKCTWYTDPVVSSCATGLTSPKFVWGDSNTPCHVGLGETFVYVGGTYNPTLEEGVPIPNHASAQEDEACP